MCGRYVVTRQVNDLLPELLHGSGPLPDDYNVAPTTDVPVVRLRDGGLQVPAARWGFLPKWAKDRSAKPQPINARIETVATSGMFKRSFARMRCIVPAMGYYEWAVTQGGKQPHFIFAPHAALAMAGIISAWPDPTAPADASDRWLLSMAIITRDAHVAPGEVHDRMPACLTPDAYAGWLDDSAGADDLLDRLHTTSAGVAATLDHYEVDRRVGNVRENDRGLVAPLGSTE